MKITPEWQEWKGGEMPVDGDRPVTVTKRNGNVRNGYGASFDWGLYVDAEGHWISSIIAYCPLDIEPYKPQPKWWVAEKGWLMFEGKVVAESILWADPRRVADALNAAGVEL